MTEKFIELVQVSQPEVPNLQGVLGLAEQYGLNLSPGRVENLALLTDKALKSASRGEMQTFQDGGLFIFPLISDDPSDGVVMNIDFMPMGQKGLLDPKILI